ncbi:hypothetical protein [Burkholderia sp. BCC1972]|uniref:hypothetical protein n=1 Tax=Burkholderia sp. BCC1972 TaxID=2817438 RepID=UPI002ABD6EE4|nr:hypothetical protein [Burkholderia sp. BCC1972]
MSIDRSDANLRIDVARTRDATRHHVHDQSVTLVGGEADAETQGVACHVYMRGDVQRAVDEVVAHCRAQ